MTERNFGQATNSFIAEIADVNDPHQCGRVRVRIYGRHDDRTNIPDSALPWAQVMQPVTSAANGRMGTAPVGLTVGSKVLGMWVDSDQQLPVVMGSVGRAGDPIEGQTVNGAPAINTGTGSIPSSGQGVPANPYTALSNNRVSIADIDSGQANITAVNVTEGVALTVAVETQMSNPTLPTVGSADKDNSDDVLDIVKAVDPLGQLSSLPCINSSLLSVNSILDFLGGIASNVISGITNTIISAIRNALLRLAQRIGIFKLLGMLNSAVANVRAIQNLINQLNIQVCGINLINQGIFDTANYVMASVINGLNTAVSTVVGGLNTVIDTATGAVLAGANLVAGAANTALNSLVDSVAAAPAVAISTAISAKPISSYIKNEPSPNYIQQYYTIENDPYPGYIEWKDPTGEGDPQYTLRGDQPNFANAKQHTEAAASRQFIATIGGTLLSGQPLTFDTLTRAVSGTVTFAQTFALSRVLGAGFGSASTIATVASLIPTVVSGIQSVFQPNVSKAKYTAESSSQAMDEYMRTQAVAARQSSQMRVGLGSTAQPLPPRSESAVLRESDVAIQLGNERRVQTDSPTRSNTAAENARAASESQATEQRNALRQPGARLIGDW